MAREENLLSVLVALVLFGAGIVCMPIIFVGRTAPGLHINNIAISGLTNQDLHGVLARFNDEFVWQDITLVSSGQQREYVLQDIGVSLNGEQVAQAAIAASNPRRWVRGRNILPSILFDDAYAQDVLHHDLASHLQLPRNATLHLDVNGVVASAPSAPGQQFDILALEQELITQGRAGSFTKPIELQVVSAAASVQDDELGAAKALTDQLLANGFPLAFEDKVFTIQPSTIRRMLMFVPQPDPQKTGNEVLGVQFERSQLQEYLVTTLAPELDQPAVNARFEIAPADGQSMRAQQFALPQRGQALDTESTQLHINQALAAGLPTAQLAVAVTEPEVSDTTAIEQLGISKLLASGASDFAGSPQNRIHNIEVGTAKYHGLLIAPGEEFSFVKYLGPVDASTGFKPELVIKNNVTTPEFGGGLCQVSTTVFRAALQSGLKVTQRRNHSYAVRYYGTPGFDATIYPPYTDLRFLNNTPGYILIQARITGTVLTFDFWGSDDGRVVAVDGPHPYSRQSNGAVKATLTQLVQKDGQTLIEDTFYSNYKSPDLFPKVLAANGERPPVPNATPSPTANPDPENKKPAPAAPSASVAPKKI